MVCPPDIPGNVILANHPNYLYKFNKCALFKQAWGKQFFMAKTNVFGSHKLNSMPFLAALQAPLVVWLQFPDLV